MSYYAISGFDNGPHFDAAIVVADSPDEAKAILVGRLAEDAADREHYGPNRIDTLWEPQPDSAWHIAEITGPLLFVLGAGCR